MNTIYCIATLQEEEIRMNTIYCIATLQEEEIRMNTIYCIALSVSTHTVSIDTLS